MQFNSIGVIGAGAWGTALALVAARAGRTVTLWARRPEHAAAMTAARENRQYLPGIALPDTIAITSDRTAVSNSDALLIAVPAQSVRRVAEAFGDLVPTGCTLVVCAKGIERGTGLTVGQALASVLPGRPIAVVSGPTFAKEVARGLPTAVTVAAERIEIAEDLAQALATPTFRPYASADVIGVEVAGALKNVIAIACGVVAGLHLGENARASLITRGLAEIRRLAVAKGGDAQTLMGLGGLGDLVLTCSSEQSRNFAFGKALGEGQPIAALLARPDVTVEGAMTASAIPALAQKHGIEMPICAAVAAVIEGEAGIDDAMAGLLSRPLGQELP